MPSISMRTGDRLTLGDGSVILVDAAQDGRVRLRVQAPAEVSVTRGEPARPAEQELRELARSIASDLSGLEAAHSQALLSGFVAELFRTAAENDRRAQRRQKQAQGIAAAKTRGVRFGRPAAPCPTASSRPAGTGGRDGSPCGRPPTPAACPIPPSTTRPPAARRRRTRPFDPFSVSPGPGPVEIDPPRRRT